jgi:hypothetical protein
VKEKSLFGGDLYTYTCVYWRKILNCISNQRNQISGCGPHEFDSRQREEMGFCEHGQLRTREGIF